MEYWNNIFKNGNDKGRAVLRIGMGLTILWFGVSQIMNPSAWIGYLPSWAFTLSFATAGSVVLLNGIFETLTSLLLIFKQFTRFVSLILAFHMATIIYYLGYGELAVRDFGLMVGLLALAFMYGNESILNRKNKK